ncbi:hypothetical protein M422DRAFT_277393 [Sphaerobolus stellatus SS14]|uniref:Uncharacterized protein n=1 Tax=Sphaerobolus stellatus (strain SS14) TaxID=990650 RepID=A0A0C9TZY6_SPHS4|nr:hypothetical protein M422DRAFT_277393 [Sphaerobolus stellatus SS14]
MKKPREQHTKMKKPREQIMKTKKPREQLTKMKPKCTYQEAHTVDVKTRMMHELNVILL